MPHNDILPLVQTEILDIPQVNGGVFAPYDQVPQVLGAHQAGNRALQVWQRENRLIYVDCPDDDQSALVRGVDSLVDHLDADDRFCVGFDGGVKLVVNVDLDPAVLSPRQDVVVCPL